MSIVVPGDALAATVRGPGTYEKDGVMKSSVAGLAHETSVSAERARLEVGASVIGRVIRVGRHVATLEIVATASGVTDLPLRGFLRREDLFPQGVDPTVLDVTQFLKGSDLIKCTIVAADDDRSYGLSTAGPNDHPVLLTIPEA